MPCCFYVTSRVRSCAVRIPFFAYPWLRSGLFFLKGFTYVPKTADVRSRRAYFDCRFGQLHVRTAFPGTGGFDEFTTLLCIHPAGGSGRVFEQFLKIIGKDRSVYAPDRPGCGESDPGAAAGAAGTNTARQDAQAMIDLAADLRLRKIDVLGFGDGCAVAVELAASGPDLVRRVAFVSGAEVGGAALLVQPSQLLKFPADAFETNPAGIAKAAAQFFKGR
jgi:pimeloyl-ACP methyl ester carboxylesterase